MNRNRTLDFSLDRMLLSHTTNLNAFLLPSTARIRWVKALKDRKYPLPVSIVIVSVLIHVTVPVPVSCFLFPVSCSVSVSVSGSGCGIIFQYLRSVPKSKRIDKRCCADVLSGREVSYVLRYLYFFMFAVFCSLSHLFRSLPGQLTPIRKHTHQTKLTLKWGKARGLGFSPKFKPFWRKVRGERLKKKTK